MHRYQALDSPLLRVSRPVAACSRCRAAKIKCDGKLPACTACEKTGRENECSSSNDQFAKGKERSYVSSLESRVEKLEKRIQYAKMRKQSASASDGQGLPLPPADRKDSLAAIRAAVHGKAARRREAVDVNELVSDFGFMSVNATGRDFDTQTTNLTFARLILAATLNEAPPKSSNKSMPPRSVAMDLVQFYLENVYSLYPAFPETALFNALDGAYSEPPRALSDFEYWLLYMALAIGSSAQSSSMRDSYYKEGVMWVGRALKHADRVLMPGHMSQIQALILLVQYSMLDPRHFDSWHLTGFMCRAIVDLGFHQDPPKELLPDKRTLEQRRKLFYCAYTLDRSISMVHARPFSFTDDATMVAFPTTLSSTFVTTFSPNKPSSTSALAASAPTSLHTALLNFQFRKAQSAWYQELFQSSRSPLQGGPQYLWQMLHEMRHWVTKLPATIPTCIRELFDLELLYSYVYCLAPSCRFPAVSDLGKTLIFEYCMQYMEHLASVTPAHFSKSFYTYHDSLRVYFIGSQFLAVLNDSFENLLSGVIPYVSVPQGGFPPPPIPNVGRSDNPDRSIRCIELVLETLGKWGERWDECVALRGSFEGMSKNILGELRRRVREQRQSEGRRAGGGLAGAGPGAPGGPGLGRGEQRPLQWDISGFDPSMGRGYA